MRRLGLIALAAVLLAAAPEPPAADAIVVVDLHDADAGTRLQVRSLQGLVNRERATAFVLQSPRDSGWLDISAHWSGAAIERLSAADFLARFRSKAKGQVFCNPAQPYTIAYGATLAGLRSAILTDRDLGLPTVADVRTLTAGDAARRLADELAAQTDPGGGVLLDAGQETVDVIVAKRWLALTPEFLRAWDATERAALAQHFAAGGAFINDPTDPIEGSDAFDAAAPLAAHGAASNLSFFAASAIPLPLRQLRYLPARIPETKYVAFLYAAGDDLGYLLDGMDPAWNAAPLSAVPVGWAIPAVSADLAPVAAYTAMAAALTRGGDQFVLDWGASAFPGRARGSALGAALRGRSARTGLGAAFVHITGGWSAAEVTEFASAGGLEGVFTTGAQAPPLGLFADTVVMPVEPAISDPLLLLGAIRRQAQTRDFVAVAVNPKTIAPAALARTMIALGEGFAVVAPYELLELQRQALLRINPTTVDDRLPLAASIGLSPEQPSPYESATVTARFDGTADLVRILYRDASGATLYVPATRAGDGYTAALPPLLPGGEFAISVQALSVTKSERRSDAKTVTVAVTDSDSDGATDAQERYARTDPHAFDTDGDGLRDGNDRRPRVVDRPTVALLDPQSPPNDTWLLGTAGRSRTEGGARHVSGADYWSYALPRWAIPEGATLAMELRGAVKVSVSTDGTQYTTILDEDFPQIASRLVPLALPQGTDHAFVKFEARAGGDAALSRFAVLSNPDGPYVPWTRIDPPLGMPGIDLSVVAQAYAPQGLKRVWLAYAARGGGEIRIPMEEIGRSQVFRAPMRDLRDRDQLSYRIIAETTDGKKCASRPLVVPVGRTPLETHTLFALSDFTGGWLPHDAWQGQAKVSQGDLCTDRAMVELGGEVAQPYVLWLLGAPSGREIIIRIDNKEKGRIRADARYGWHQVGVSSLEGGAHTIEVIVDERQRSGAEAVYAELLLTRSTLLQPPPAALLPYFDRIALLGPAPGSVVSGKVTVRASVSGNVEYVKLRVNDQEQPTQYIRPPYAIEWVSARVPDGRYTLTVVAYGTTRGIPVMEVSTEVIVKNKPGG